MSDVGLYGFDIPHDFVRPTRDMVIIRIPFPPEKSAGGIITPQQSLDLLVHNVMAGRIVAMGPVAFFYKQNGEEKVQDVAIGDWVLIRPYAGTMMQGGKITVNSGYRYVSSYQDVIGIVPKDKMPDPKTLIWEYNATPATGQKDFEFDKNRTTGGGPDNGVRERIVFKKDK